MPDLFKEILPSIMERKDVVIHDEIDERDYVPFMVNRALSLHQDCLYQAQEMNKLHVLPKIMQYHFLMATVRKCRRKYQPWPKRQKDEDLKLVMHHFDYNRNKAIDAMKILTEEHMEQLRTMYQDIDIKAK